MSGFVALDLFAGTGWGVACQRLGIEEHGVELMPEAVATREANGMHTIYRDVWEGLERPRLLTDEERAARRGRGLERPIEEWDEYDLLIASPPCQTFSMAGGGAGRRALDDVLGLIRDRAYLDVAALRAFGETHDPRTALVLTPLAHVARDTPTYVVFEQVPPVLPVWEACAAEMRRWGYSVWTGIVNSEQYGVPQTRRRAILIARADGLEALPPEPTHSRYYSRTPGKMDEGVAPWVSMAEALGWGRSARPSVTVTGGGTETGGAEPLGHLAREQAAEDWTSRRPATTIAGDSRVWPPGHKVNAADIERLGEEEARSRYQARSGRAYQSNHNTSTTGERYERDAEAPAPAITSGSRSARWLDEEGPERMRSNYSAGGPEGATAEERGLAERDVDAPAFTMTSKGAHWVVTGGATTERFEPRDVETPAPPITGTDNVYHGHGDRFTRDEDGRKTKSASAERVTPEEAAALQSYPASFVWDVKVPDAKGVLRPVTKTKKFLQIGNAVPPLMAEAIIVAAIGRPSA